jgi:hypothetical protein
MTFAKGAALDDPSGLFNSSLDGNARRAIDIHEGDKRGSADFVPFKSAVLNMVNVHFLWTCGYGDQSPEPRVVAGGKPQTL